MCLNSKKALPWCVALGVSLVCVGVRADMTFEAVGQPMDSGSWQQSLSLLSPDMAFQTVGLVFMWPSNDPVSGFKDPAWDFSTGGFGNPHSFEETLSIGRFLTVASGDSTNGLLWDSHFYGDKALQEFVLTAFIYGDHPWDGSYQRGVAHWDGTAWDFQTAYGGVTWDEYVDMGGTTPAVVPAPSAVALGILGLASVGVFRRRFRM